MNDIGEIITRWQKDCFSWDINVNSNKSYYQSAKDALSEREAISSNPLDIDPKIREQMELSNQYVSIHLYPDNGIGSYEVFHYSLVAAILEMEEILKDH